MTDRAFDGLFDRRVLMTPEVAEFYPEQTVIAACELKLNGETIELTLSAPGMPRSDVFTMTDALGSYLQGEFDKIDPDFLYSVEFDTDDRTPRSRTIVIVFGDDADMQNAEERILRAVQHWLDAKAPQMDPPRRGIVLGSRQLLVPMNFRLDAKMHEDRLMLRLPKALQLMYIDRTVAPVDAEHFGSACKVLRITTVKMLRAQGHTWQEFDVVNTGTGIVFNIPFGRSNTPPAYRLNEMKAIIGQALGLFARYDSSEYDQLVFLPVSRLPEPGNK